MNTDRIYVDSREPGAPKAGDVVVVVHDFAPEHAADVSGPQEDGLVAALVHVDTHTGVGQVPYHWHVLAVQGERVHAVRWPTPEELAAYQLGRG